MAGEASTQFGAAVQDIFTRGLDAAVKYYSNRFAVNDPTPSVAGPNGERVAAGQSAANAPGSPAVPSWVWYAGLALLAAAVVVPLVRRR
jgi:hypothetical protein